MQNRKIICIIASAIVLIALVVVFTIFGKQWFSGDGGSEREYSITDESAQPVKDDSQPGTASDPHGTASHSSQKEGSEESRTSSPDTDLPFIPVESIREVDLSEILPEISDVQEESSRSVRLPFIPIGK